MNAPKDNREAFVREGSEARTIVLAAMRVRKGPSAIVAYLALSCALGPLSVARATGDTDHPETVRLPEVIVSEPRDEGEAAQAVITVTAEDMKSEGARTLDEALNLLPGVDVRTGGNGVPRIDIHGFRARQVLVLLDGVPLNSAYDNQFNPTLLSTAHLQTIKVVEGASSVLYGPGGLGGVVDITTKRGKEGIDASFALETGEDAPYLAGASLSGATKGFDYVLSGSTTHVDCFRLSASFVPTSEQAVGCRLNSDIQRTHLLASLGLSPSPDLRVGLTARFVQGYFGKPPSIFSSAQAELDLFANAPFFDRVDQQAELLVQSTVDYAFTKRFSLSTEVFVNALRELNDQYDNGLFNSFVMGDSFQEWSTAQIAGVALRPSYSLGAFGTFGALLSAEDARWLDKGFFNTGPNNPRSVDDFHYYRTYSTALEYQVSPVKGLGLALGYGQHWQDRAEMDATANTALASASYALLDDTRLKASFSKNVRFPSLRELYDPTQGNTALVPEQAYTFEGGLEQNLPMKTTVRLEGFYTQAANYIQQDVWSEEEVNVPKMLFAGGDVAAMVRPLKGLMLQGSYAYLRTHDESGDGRDELQYSPRNKVALEGRYAFPFGLAFNISYRYGGQQFCYTRENIWPPIKLPFGNYEVVDVKVSQDFWDGRWTIYAGAKNLFDFNYETAYGYPAPGRYIYGGFEFHTSSGEPKSDGR